MFFLRDLAPAAYGGKWCFLLLSCVALELGAALEVLPDVLMLPGEGSVSVLSKKYGHSIGLVKTLYDLAMVAAALFLSLICLGEFMG